jgi:hypothetical protein
MLVCSFVSLGNFALFFKIKFFHAHENMKKIFMEYPFKNKNLSKWKGIYIYNKNETNGIKMKFSNFSLGVLKYT